MRNPTHAPQRGRGATAAGLGIGAILAAALTGLTPATLAHASELALTSPGESTFTVPAGVTSLHVVLSGGAGGSTVDTALPSTTRTVPGGAGGKVTADLAVTPGEVLYLEVGADGSTTPGDTAAGGGGAGGTSSLQEGTETTGASGGGGATDIQTCAAASCSGSDFGTVNDPRLVVAGGGGGAGAWTLDESGAGEGGSAGSPAQAGNDGVSGVGITGEGIGGGGGTSDGGGTGGAGGTSEGLPSGGAGTTGSATTGGSGGDGEAEGAGGGGGGGGGYWAGGGAGGGAYLGGGIDGEGSGGGGGGGANFAGSTATNVTSTTTSGQPGITITYQSSSTTSVSAAPIGGATTGQPVILSTSVAVASGPAATGTVTMTEGDTTLCTVTLNAGAGSCDTAFASSGSQAILATYSGDTNHGGSSGTTVYEVLKSSTTTTVTASPTSPTAGESFTLTAVVTAHPGATSAVSSDVRSDDTVVPSGTVDFTAAGATIGGCGAVALVNGTATCDTSFATAGSVAIDAVFSGDDATLTSTGTLALTVAAVIPVPTTGAVALDGTLVWGALLSLLGGLSLALSRRLRRLPID